MTLTNTALRSISRAATSAIRQSAATPMVLQGTQRIQESTRNFSSPIAIESSDNQEIATILLMLSPSPPTNSNSLQQTETPSSRNETEGRRERDKTDTENSSYSQRREEKKRELSHFLLWAELSLKMKLRWCHRAIDARASIQRQQSVAISSSLYSTRRRYGNRNLLPSNRIILHAKAGLYRVGLEIANNRKASLEKRSLIAFHETSLLE